MSVFKIIRNCREAELVEPAPSSFHRKRIHKYQSSTKNNIHHYGAIIKRVLWKAYFSKRLSYCEVRKAIKCLQAATGMDSFVKSFSARNVAQALRDSTENGEFVRFLLESDIEGANKCDAFKYPNSLFNAFRTGNLKRWIDEEEGTPTKKKAPLRKERQVEVSSSSEELEETFTVEAQLSSPMELDENPEDKLIEPAVQAEDMFGDFDLDFRLDLPFIHLEEALYN